VDIAMVTKLIGDIGFPYAALIALGYFVWRLWQQSVKREEKLMETNGQAIDTIAKYADKLDIIQADVSEIKTDITTLLANKQ
jgi:hypothetical protein